jgi:hypothetical protein
MDQRTPKHLSRSAIPDSAAIGVLLGGLIASGGFVAAWLTTSGLATLVMTGGLYLAAWALRKAELVIQET